MNEWQCSVAEQQQRCWCLAEGKEVETFPLPVFARILQFPLAAEKILFIFFFFYFAPPSTHTQTVILMAVRIHCNVVQEEEEVTGRHSMRGGGGGRVSLGCFALLSVGRRTSVNQRGFDWRDASGGFSGGLFTRRAMIGRVR